MLASWIVEHFDLVEHVLFGFGLGFVGPAPYPIALEQVEEALGHRLVMTFPAPAHRVFENVMLQE